MSFMMCAMGSLMEARHTTRGNYGVQTISKVPLSNQDNWLLNVWGESIVFVQFLQQDIILAQIRYYGFYPGIT